MLLSVQQRKILETLRKLGCSRKDQLLALVRKDCPKVSARGLDAMLHQLRAGRNDIRLEGDLVRLSGIPPNRLRCLDKVSRFFRVQASIIPDRRLCFDFPLLVLIENEPLCMITKNGLALL